MIGRDGNNSLLPASAGGSPKRRYVVDSSVFPLYGFLRQLLLNDEGFLVELGNIDFLILIKVRIHHGGELKRSHGSVPDEGQFGYGCLFRLRNTIVFEPFFEDQITPCIGKRVGKEGRQALIEFA